jgi:hypothetical protein
MKITSALIAIVVGLVLVSPLGADTIHQKGQVQANGITIAYESFGKPDRETILLIGGTGMQLTDWPTEFCEELASRGYRVIIYDNHDIGLSSKFDAAGMTQSTTFLCITRYLFRSRACRSLIFCARISRSFGLIRVTVIFPTRTVFGFSITAAPKRGQSQ